MRTRLLMLAGVSALGAVVLSGCGDSEVQVSDDTTTVPPEDSGVNPGAGGAAGGISLAMSYRGVGTVLEAPGAPVQFCQMVAMSYPPQCQGVELIDWSWDAVDGEESANGVTWGEYTVTGTYEEGGKLRVTDATTPTEDDRGEPFEPVDMATRCDAPPQGWAATDPTKVSSADWTAASAYAETQPDFAASWVDTEVEAPDYSAEVQGVWNVTFTGDLAAHEAEIAKLWGGPVCVSAAQRSLAELTEIAQEAQSLVDPVMAYTPDPIAGVVRISVGMDAGHTDTLNERFGEGVVVVESFLAPLEDGPA